MDLAKKVGGEKLKVNWSEIHVQIPIIWGEHLIRPYAGLKTVGDAIGTPIAWLVSLVRLMPNIVYFSILIARQ
ncbi:hypothetical protein RHMOL_Rhmol13G0169200 [Rhododendron molle]|uniref:Uncharacterized protein n=1 Tax=Rhododendron molle TaxID=49168 RepID=A0ACC0L7W3_RHOML|nr:hypothetical protein RHMOL_Rhmol13G0169200 [Rhododendron molle]